MRRIAAGLAVLAVVDFATATNVIQEWGGVHQPPEYEIVQFLGQDIAVKIHSNAHPNDPWLFQAFDSVTHEPGYIDYIRIESTTSVGNIHLSVVRDPNLYPPSPYGAVALKFVDLVDFSNPAYPNFIDQIVISGDFGEDGPMRAHGAGTLAIGQGSAGDVLHNIEITGDITGATTIYGTLRADITCHGLGDLTVGNGIAASPVPKIEVGSMGSPTTYASTLQVTGTLPRVIIWGDVTGAITSTEGAAGDVTVGAVTGTIDIDGDFPTGKLTLGSLGTTNDAAEVTVNGNLRDAAIDGVVEIGSSFKVVENLGTPNTSLGLKVVGDNRGTIEIGAVFGHLDILGAVAPGASLVIDRDICGLDEHGGGVEVAGAVGGVARVEQDLRGRLCVGYGEGTTSSIESDGRVEILGNIDVEGLGNGLRLPHQVAGRIHISGNALGPIQNNTYDPMTGEIEIDGSVGSPTSDYGGVTIVGDLAGRLTLGDVYNTVSVISNLTGHIHATRTVQALINVNGNLGDTPDPCDPPFMGYIRIDGGFVPSGLIRIAGDIVNPTSFIAVDYDATGDDWVYNEAQDRAIVQVEHGDPENPTIYTGNTPDDFVWEISEFKGDMNGDNCVNFGDINPFVLALSSPLEYSTYYPGLGCTSDPNDPDCLWGSRVWHGDINEDGSLNFADINPFVALITNFPCCPCDGGDSMQGGTPDGSEGGLPDLSPEEMAAQLAANVWPELYGDLLGMILVTIETAPDDETQAYWQAVYAALL